MPPCYVSPYLPIPLHISPYLSISPYISLQESAVMPPAISGSIASRFTWTYNRAAGAMLTTTATTVKHNPHPHPHPLPHPNPNPHPTPTPSQAFCLLLNATAPFPAFRTFGIFNAFIVICDYVMVITWCAIN